MSGFAFEHKGFGPANPSIGGLGDGRLTSGGEVAPDEARRALERVLDSAEFAQATRLSDFLRHVVTETLEGRAASLKGYSIAVDVFGRPDDFDQASDPIVRVEASRLRRALAQYYQGSGNGDPVVIELPRGAYVPAFRRRGAVEEPAEAEPDEAAEGEAAPPAPPPPPRADRDVVRFRIATLVGLGLALLGLAYLVWSNLAGRQTAETPPPPAGMMARAVAVADLEVLGEAADSADFARGLATALLTELTRFHDLDVSALETGSNPPSAGYILRGAAAHAGPTLRVTLQLVEARGGRAVWSETYERDYKADQVLAIETEIARTAARELAQPYGAIYAREIEAIAGADPKTLTGYACVLLTYEYWRSFDPKAHFEARDCLERTVAATPGYAAAWQALAYLYLDEYLYNYNVRPGASDPRDRGLAAAQKAVGLAPTDALSYQSLYAALFAKGDIEGFRAAGTEALRLNSNNPDIVADYGEKLAIAGFWDEGLKLLRQAMDDNPARPGWYHTALVLDAYYRGDYKAALAYAERMRAPDHYRWWFYLTMIYGQMGDTQNARKAVERLNALDPDFGLNARTDLAKWGYAPALAERCLDGLRKAGLVVDGEYYFIRAKLTYFTRTIIGRPCPTPPPVFPPSPPAA